MRAHRAAVILSPALSRSWPCGGGGADAPCSPSDGAVRAAALRPPGEKGEPGLTLVAEWSKNGADTSLTVGVGKTVSLPVAARPGED
eukprot:gene11447-50111_t